VIPAFRWFGPADPIPLGHIRQIPGVRSVVSALYDVPIGEAWGRDRLATLKAQIEDAGLCLAVVESIPVHEDIKLGRPTRDRLIDRYCASVRAMGDLRIPVLCYNFMPVFDWMRTDLARRLPDGSTALAYDDRALYFGTQSGSVWTSRRGGTQWTEAARDLPPILSVEAAPA